MKCLRKAVNKTRRDKIRNEVIRDMAGAKPVLQHIKQQQAKWVGHITRMPINQPALRACNTKYSGWRARGRPRKRWSDSVAHTLKTQGMSLLQATRLAADRQLCPPATPIGTSGRKKQKQVLNVLNIASCSVYSNTVSWSQYYPMQRSPLNSLHVSLSWLIV